MKKKRWLLPALLAALLAAGCGLWLALGTGLTAVPAASAALAEASRGLDDIVIEAQLNPDARTLTVTQRLTMTSRVEESRDQLVLRTWPNAFQNLDTSPIGGEKDRVVYYPDGFSSGSLVMAEAKAGFDGSEQPVYYRYLDEAKTVLMLPLPETWDSGETLTVTLRYSVTVPRAKYRFGVWENTFALGNAFAIPAVWQDGAYRADPYEPVGDPLAGDVANYSLSLTLPKGYQCAATGVVTDAGVNEGRDGWSVYTIQAPAVREVGLSISPAYHRAAGREGDVLVEAYAYHPKDAQRMLTYAKKALRCFSQLYGAYPYQTFTLCETHLPQSGMEYPGMVMLSSALMARQDDQLEYTIVHETAHQWWYAVVGSDSVNHPWMDEALCEYSLLEYVEAYRGANAREELRQSRVETSMRVTVPKGATPGAPLGYFASMNEYSILVYGRATSLLCAMDDMLHGGLNVFLSEYYQRCAFSFVDRDTFSKLLSEVTGMDLEPLMVDYLDTYLMN